MQGVLEVSAALDKATACNCSICSRVGYLLAFVEGDDFTLVSGGDALADYQFGAKRYHHRSCLTCGVHPFVSGSAPDGCEMYGVNIRCLADVNTDALLITKADGKSL